VILFFDRSVGKSIPLALREYLKPPGLQVEYHEEHFDMAAQDEDWLPIVGAWGWIVIGQDHSYHDRSPEVQAIRTHDMGAFYLWGAEAPKWETMRVFAKAYDKILKAADVTPRPFVIKVQKSGALNELII